MKNSDITLALSFIFCCVAIAAPDNPSPTDLSKRFDRAVELQNSGKDPDEAIKLFQSVFDAEPASNLGIRARLRQLDLYLTTPDKDDYEKKAKEALTKLFPDRTTPALRAPPASDPRTFEALLNKLERESFRGRSQEQLMEAALKGITAILGPGAEYFPPSDDDSGPQWEPPKYGAGIVLRDGPAGINIAWVVRTSPAWFAGVQTGWTLTSVEGKTTAEFHGWREAVNAIRGPKDTPLRLTFRLPDDSERTLTIVRNDPDHALTEGVFSHHLTPDGLPLWMTEDGIASASITSLYSREEHRPKKQDAAADLRSAFTGSPPPRAFLLDLRSTRGGTLEQALKVADMFIGEGEIARHLFPFYQADHYSATAEGDLPDIPMVVLVNGYTVSTAELVAGALQDRKRAKIIGRRTYGRGEVRAWFDAPGGGVISAPGSEYLRAGGVHLERRPGATAADEWGVTPDLLVPPGAPPPTATERQPEEEWQRRWDYTPPDKRKAALMEDIQYQAALKYLREKLAAK